CRCRTRPEPWVTFATRPGGSIRARTRAIARSPSAFRPRSNGRLSQRTREMKTLRSNKLVIATAVLTTFGAITYACKNFLDQPAQGVLDESTLTNRAGVEGSLIAAYRALDCDDSSAGSWGCAASNWVWGSVTSGDAYKGSNLGDQQPINDIETFQWTVGE